jgi:membrane-bound lytic murein transglycosylase D
MSLAQTLSTYVTINLLVVLGYLVLRAWRSVVLRKNGQVSSSDELRLHYLVFGTILVITFVHPLLPKHNVFHPAAKVWSAESIKRFPGQYTSPDKGGYINLPFVRNGSAIDADKVSAVLLLVSLLVLCLGSVRILKDIRELRRIRQSSCVVRRIGRVCILANDRILVPFSFWLPGGSYVVIPSSITVRVAEYRMVVAHEIQHHRQMDTKWVYIVWAFRILCVLNPVIHLWSRRLAEIQEFACDETLVDRKKVESLQYIRCLLEVAETTVNRRFAPVCATGLTFLIERNLLKRRIEKMMSLKLTKTKSKNVFVTGVAIGLMAATAFASQGLVQDRRVSMADAQRMVEKANSESDFPVMVNDLVLTQLNRYIGTPEGREFMRTSLQRMENYRLVVESKIVEYQVPMELAAIPIVESGYQNLGPNSTPGVGAGIWMFLAQTARRYGLQVDDQVDERLNSEMLTDAAMRYLKGGKLQFNDWLLSVLGYNIGEKRVLRGIDTTGSRDAWVLVRSGYENDKDYLAKLMAAILIMKNPESVE